MSSNHSYYHLSQLEIDAIQQAITDFRNDRLDPWAGATADEDQAVELHSMAIEARLSELEGDDFEDARLRVSEDEFDLVNLDMQQHLQGRLDAEVKQYRLPFPGSCYPHEKKANEDYARGYEERRAEIEPLPIIEDNIDEL